MLASTSLSQRDSEEWPPGLVERSRNSSLSGVETSHAKSLKWVVIGLGCDPQENKALVRAKLTTVDPYAGDPEIEQVASMVDRIKVLQAQIGKTEATDAQQIRDLAETLQLVANLLLDYYK